jgi:hypothetical protein
MFWSEAPELALGVQVARSLRVVWALELIAERALCAVDRLVETMLLLLVSVWSWPTCSLSDSS